MSLSLHHPHNDKMLKYNSILCEKAAYAPDFAIYLLQTYDFLDTNLQKNYLRLLQKLNSTFADDGDCLVDMLSSREKVRDLVEMVAVKEFMVQALDDQT